MERLTKRNSCGVEIIGNDAKGVLEKLAGYEDLGLSPEQLGTVADTINSLAPLTVEIHELRKERDFWKNESLKWEKELDEEEIRQAKRQ